jgi:hypothetical protein
MKPEKTIGTTDFSTANLISEILELVRKQTEMLKTESISPGWTAEYKCRAWQIRQLIESLRIT